MAGGGGLIAASKPILVTQFANSADFDGVDNADSFMVVVPPRRFFSTNVMLSAAGTNFVSHYVNVVAPIGPGTHPVTLSVSDTAGNIGSCVITLTVIDPSMPRIDCPEMVVTNCLGGEAVPVDFTVTAWTDCTGEVPVFCQPASGSLFAPGTTTVACVATNALGDMVRCEFAVVVRCLTISPAPTGNAVIVDWGGVGTLETADQVTGPWRSLPELSSPATLFIKTRQAFFRVGP